MTTPESKFTFFRQSGWMMVATVGSGVFMVAVHAIINRIEPAEYGVFFTLLRVLQLMGIPAAGLQTVFAQQTAGALDDGQRSVLAATTRAVLAGILLVWLAMAAVTFLGQKLWLAELKVTNPAALWLTVLIGLVFLCLPVLRGLLQGHQQFAGLGWVLILDGVGRFLAIGLSVWLGGQAAGAMGGALAGQLAALVVAAWLTRSVWRERGSGFEWRPWLSRVVPLTLGVGALLTMMNADVVLVQTLFPPTQTSTTYMPAALIGFAMINFTTPLAAVMFPKLARSVARTEPTDVARQALAATALLGGLAALGGTLLPELPLKIIYFRNGLYWQAAPLVPWFAWGLLPLLLANVLVGSLLARGQFAVVPWLLVVAAGYVTALAVFSDSWCRMAPVAAFKQILQTLGLFNLALLGVAAWFTWGQSVSDSPRPGSGSSCSSACS